MHPTLHVLHPTRHTQYNMHQHAHTHAQVREWVAAQYQAYPGAVPQLPPKEQGGLRAALGEDIAKDSLVNMVNGGMVNTSMPMTSHTTTMGQPTSTNNKSTTNTTNSSSNTTTAAATQWLVQVGFVDELRVALEHCMHRWGGTSAAAAATTAAESHSNNNNNNKSSNNSNTYGVVTTGTTVAYDHDNTSGDGGSVYDVGLVQQEVRPFVMQEVWNAVEQEVQELLQKHKVYWGGECTL